MGKTSPALADLEKRSDELVAKRVTLRKSENSVKAMITALDGGVPYAGKEVSLFANPIAWITGYVTRLCTASPVA